MLSKSDSLIWIPFDGFMNTVNSKSYIPINFFSQQIFVKNGIGIIARLLDAEIIPVVSFRDENERNTMTFHKEISKTDYNDKETFAIKSIESCYLKLEEKLKVYPTQWECWLYIHNWFRRDHTPYTLMNDFQGVFNTDRYITFTVHKSYFLLDMLSYQSFPIEKKIVSSFDKEQFQ